LIRLAGIGAGMVTNALLARTLAPAGYGALSLALTLMAAVAQTADLGIAITAAARIARLDTREAGRTLGTGLAIRTVAGVIGAVGLASLGLAGAFGDASTAVAIAAVATPLGAASVVSWGWTARFRPEAVAALTLLQGALWLVAVAGVHRWGGNLLTLAWGYVVVTVLQTAVSFLVNRRIIPVRAPSWLEAKRLFAVSWPLAVSSFALIAYYRLDSVILFHARGATELGYYAAGYKFIDVAQFAPTALVAPLLPLAAMSLTMEDERRRKILSLATRVALVIGVVGAAMFIALAVPLIDVIYGDGFAPAVRPLSVLAISFVGLSLNFVGTTVLSALGRAKPIALVSVMVAIASLSSQAVVSPRWGATGAATVAAVTQVTVAAIYIVLAARAMRTRLPIAEIASVLALLVLVVAFTTIADWPWTVEAPVVVVFLGLGLVIGRVLRMEDLRRVLARRELG
jgi:O-antigen/teichoic acid export membrane protein